jgi:hypothetical protein
VRDHSRHDLTHVRAEETRAALQRLGVRIRTESRWLNALSVEADSSTVQVIAHLPGVEAVRPVRTAAAPPARPTFVDGQRLPRSGTQTTGSLSLSQELDELGVLFAREAGLTGTGIRVGILGTAVRLDHGALRNVEILATRDFVAGDDAVTPEVGEALEEAGPGTAALAIIAGDLPERDRGPAFGSSYALARVEEVSSARRVEEDLWVAGLEWLESLGVRVVVSLVGFREFDDFAYGLEWFDGDQIPATLAADEAARRGVLVVVPVGNGGPGGQTLVAPADGDSVISVGASDAAGRPAGFSARGPTSDGRRKPEILAPGVGLVTAGVAAPDDTVAVDGTEFAGALIGGIAALFAEAHPERGPLSIAEALISSARSRPDGVASNGPGVPDVASAIFFPDGLRALPLQEVTPAGTVTSLVPRFFWDAPTVDLRALPVVFRLQAAEDSAFSEVVVRDSVVGAFARRPAAPLPPRRRLFWRVEAETTQGVRRRTETQGPIEVPSWVTLLVLNDPAGVTIEETRPTLEWDAFDVPAPAGPLAFELQVLSDRDQEPIQSFPDLRETSFRIPDPLPFNLPLRWRVIATAPVGGADTVTSAGPFVITSRSRPPVTILFQNYPNPFPREDLGRSVTRIWFDLSTPGEVTLEVFDLRGRRIRRLIPASGCAPITLESGLYGRDEVDLNECTLLHWDGKDDQGREVPRGVYLLRLRARDVEEIRRMVYWP